MKSRVDPLIKVLEIRQQEARIALAKAQEQLAMSEAERDGAREALQDGHQRYESAQARPLGPEEHDLHHQWLKQMRHRLEVLEKKAADDRNVVETRRDALREVHTELRSLELYKENLRTALATATKRREALELDEIAGLSHGRKASGTAD